MNCFWSVRIAYTTAVSFAVLSVFISVFFYTKIYLRLRQHKSQVGHVQQRHPNRKGHPLIIWQYKKTVYSIAWVQLAMVLCYVPFTISAIIVKMTGWRSACECRYRLDICSNCLFLKLVSKPDSLLVEDNRSKTSSKR